MARRIAMYLAWDRTAETSADLGDIDNRYPTLFEFRRQFWPRFEGLAHAPEGQDIDGFLAEIFMQNFAGFTAAVAASGQPLQIAQRRTASSETLLDPAFLDGVDTLIVISVDGQRTGQTASPAECAAVRTFLQRPGTMLFVCPHHDIGDTDGLNPPAAEARVVAEFDHHGDVAVPGRQRVGGFGMSLMAGLGAPIRNRFGLRPTAEAPDVPKPFVLAAEDRFGLLDKVPYLNLHAHLPHYERVGAGTTALEVLARLEVDPSAPPHPVMAPGAPFDAILQASPEAGLGRLVVCDMTLWASTFKGLPGLQVFWKNVIFA